MSGNPTYASVLSPEYALLGLLAERPAHGYQLHQRLTAELGQVWRVSLSQAYNILNRLEAQGLIAGREEKPTSQPARRLFRLTPAGKRRFERWLRAPTGCSARAVRVEFLARLYFTHMLYPQLVPRLVDQQIAVVQGGLVRLERLLPTVDPEQVINRLGVELRINQLRSLLDWLRQCRSRFLNLATISSRNIP